MVDGIKNNGVGTAAASRTARSVPAAAAEGAGKSVRAAPSAESVLTALAQPAAPVDQARIDGLRARIGDGSYRPDPAAIAKAIIERNPLE